MDIVYKKISEIVPYLNNPRINDHAVAGVANSIKEFGFKQPILIDKDNVIIAGHTRLKAAKMLGLTEVPTITADDLTPKQVKAYRLADNKVAEAAFWDAPLLDRELDELFDFDMGRFDFDVPSFTDDLPFDRDTEVSKIKTANPLINKFPEQEPEDDEEEKTGYYGDARERTADIYLLYDFDVSRAAGKYQMPVLLKENHVPKRLIGFNYLLSSDDFDAGIHFFIDDYQFERIWNNPDRYVEKILQYDCVLTPDFSLYMNMPMAMKVWNVYRSRLVGQILQDSGAKVIPTLSWAERETFEFCFDGLEKGGTVAVSTIGVKRDENALRVWEAGMNEAISRLEPETIVVYGGALSFDYQGIPTVEIKNEVTEQWRNSGKSRNFHDDEAKETVI